VPAGSRRSTPLGIILCFLVLVGCADARTGWWPWSNRQTEQTDASTPLAYDSPFTDPEATPTDRPVNAATFPAYVELRVIHLHYPHTQRERAERIWEPIREDVVDTETALRLRKNGFRVGIGHERDWDAIRSTLDLIPDCTSNVAQPVKLVSGLPLDLQLDNEPREQTIFYVGRDGMLAGDTWPDSRNVLRLVHQLDPRVATQVHLSIVPVVNQEIKGWRWVRTEAGVAQVPKRAGQTYPDVAFSTPLDEGEFLVIAAGERSDVKGIIGRAFLTVQSTNNWQDSILFIEPVVHYGP
jgi:hypothetical protein